MQLMWKKYKKYIKYPVIILAAITIANFFTRKGEIESHPRDYEEIIRSGILRVVTEYNSVSFYVNGDTISGFHHDLIQAFARDKGLQLEITPEMSFVKQIQGVETGSFDILANSTLVTTESKDSILFTQPICLNKQVLIQRKHTDSLFIKNQLDLAHRTLHIVKGSPVILRIHNLGNEIGDTIYVKEVEKYGSEQLLAMVAHGDIDYAVCDESIARASIDSFPQLDMNMDISFTQFYSWGVSKHSPALLDSLNAWLQTFTKEKEFDRMYKKYYK